MQPLPSPPFTLFVNAPKFDQIFTFFIDIYITFPYNIEPIEPPWCLILCTRHQVVTSFMDGPKCNTVYNTASSWIPLYNYWIGGHEMGVPLNDSHESSLFLRISITCNWLLVTESRDLFGFSPWGAIHKQCWQKFQGFLTLSTPNQLRHLWSTMSVSNKLANFGVA